MAQVRHIHIRPPGKDGVRMVVVDDKIVGTLTRPKYAPRSTPGWFLTLDGVTWCNAPGARYTADAGAGAPSTYVRSVQQAMERIETHYKQKDNKDA